MDDAPLAGRRALVTGAARRTGRVLALGLAQAGADVSLTSRRADHAAHIAEGIRQLELPSCLLSGDTAVERISCCNFDSVDYFNEPLQITRVSQRTMTRHVDSPRFSH